MHNFNTRSKDLGILMIVGGPGGSGASTIAGMLARHFSLNYVYGGKVMRSLAKGYGFKNINEFFNSDVFKENSFDFLIDQKLFQKSLKKDVLIDSKVFAALATKNDIACTVKIWLDAHIDVRSKRTVGKKKGDVCFDDVRENLKKRFENDRKRFLDLYGIDFENQEKYNDIVIDSSKQSEQETFNLVLELIEQGGYLNAESET